MSTEKLLETGLQQFLKSGSHCARGRSRKLSRSTLLAEALFSILRIPSKSLWRWTMEFQKKLGRDVPAPNTLNPKNGDPLVLAKPYRVLGRALETPQVNPTRLVARVVFCFGNKGATAERLSRDCGPQTNDVTGI